MKAHWRKSYKSRLGYTKELLQTLILKDKKNEYMEDLKLVTYELNNPKQGEIFSTKGFLYDYESIEGSTKNVYNYLENTLLQPNLCQVILDPTKY